MVPAAVIYCSVHGVSHHWTLAGAPIVLVEVRLPHSCTETSGVIWHFTVRSLSSPTPHPLLCRQRVLQILSQIPHKKKRKKKSSLHYQSLSFEKWSRSAVINTRNYGNFAICSRFYDSVYFSLRTYMLTDLEIHRFQSSASSGGRQVWTQCSKTKPQLYHTTQENLNSSVSYRASLCHHKVIVEGQRKQCDCNNFPRLRFANSLQSETHLISEVYLTRCGWSKWIFKAGPKADKKFEAATENVSIFHFNFHLNSIISLKSLIKSRISEHLVCFSGSKKTTPSVQKCYQCHKCLHIWLVVLE